MREISNYYIYPERARKKMRMAHELKSPVYLYGATGYGKTAFLEHYFKGKEYRYFLAGEVLESQLLPENFKRGEIVIIDDIQLAEPTGVREKIIQLIRKNDVWMILCGRCECPGWLLAVSLKMRTMVTIEEDDFRLSPESIATFFMNCNVPYKEDELQDLITFSRGHGMTVMMIADLLVRGESDMAELKHKVQKLFWDYLDENVCNQWDVQLREFLMQLSIVDSFTIPMAEAITDKENVRELLKKAKETGNFLKEEAEVYTMDRTLHNCLHRRLLCECSEDYRMDLYYNAGRFYEQQGKAIEALKMFELCKNENRISSILIENARKDPNSGFLYELRHYYLLLPKEKIESSLDLTAGMSMLESLRFHVEESEYWYQVLKEKENILTGSEKKAARNWLAYLDIALPHRGSANLVEIFKKFGVLLMNRQLALPEFSVTSGTPSQMNGGKDFCDWSKIDRQLANSIGKLIPLILGKYGRGMVDLALAESIFEKGEDDYEVLRLVSTGILQADNGGKLEQSFVGNAILARIRLINGEVAEAEKLIQNFRKRVLDNEEKIISKVLVNVDAFLCRLYLYQGEKAQIEEWMKQAPNEEEDFFSMDRYRYLTKIRVYIVYGSYEKAFLLLEKMAYYAEKMERTFIKIEVLILKAILSYRMKRKDWKEKLEQGYSLAEEYHFVRILSREGTALLPLLEGVSLPVTDKEFYKQVMKETEQMSSLYPSYLRKNSADFSFPENAIKILRYQAEGMTNEEIARLLGVNVGTVKYHCKENYKKLGVKGKAAAISEARKRKLI